MKNLNSMTLPELKELRTKINKEIARRETENSTCIWAIKNSTELPKEDVKSWEGETYIS